MSAPSSSASSGPLNRGRAMIYPYTVTAKLVQFPLRFYLKNNWVWRYMLGGLLLSVPVFLKISSMANSPENVAKYEESRRKAAAEHHH